jgi:hypothetical protein
MRLSPLLLLLLIGCSKPEPDRKEKMHARIEAAKQVESKTPEPRTYTINGHQLVVVDLSSADSEGYIDEHKCFIWRDVEFRTATMSCSHPDAISGPDIEP